MASEAKFRTVIPNNTIQKNVPYTPSSQVYASKTSNIGPAENMFIANDVELSLNTMASGTTATLLLPPSYKLVKQIILGIRISLADANRLSSDFAAYHFIQRFAYRVPGCERMIFEGYNLPFQHITQCTSPAQLKKLLRISGCHDNFYATPGVGLATASLDKAGGSGVYGRGDSAASLGAPEVLEGIDAASGDVWYYMICPLPWSQIHPVGSVHDPEPYPAHMTTSNLELEWTFRDLSKVVTSGSAITLKQTKVTFLYESLAAPQEYRQATYKYPFIACFDHVYPATVQATKRVDVNIQGLRSGEQREFVMHVGKLDRADKAPFEGYRLSDIEVQYAGQTIWHAPEISTELYELLYGGAMQSRIPAVQKLDVLTAGTQLVTTTDATHGIMTASITANRALVEVSDVYASQLSSSSSNIDLDNNLPRYYYTIPVSSFLTKIIGKNYALGADFKDSDLRISFKVHGLSNGDNVNVYVQSRMNAIYNFDGQTAKLVL